jgi:hypothetical protein
MGFHDSYTDGGGGNFVGKEEKEELIASGDTFPITQVRTGGTQWGEKFFCTIILDDEERVMSFGKGGEHPVESRDRMLSAYTAYLEEGNEPDVFSLTRKGNSLLLINPNETEA